MPGLEQAFLKVVFYSGSDFFLSMVKCWGLCHSGVIIGFNLQGSNIVEYEFEHKSVIVLVIFRLCS